MVRTEFDSVNEIVVYCIIALLIAIKPREFGRITMVGNKLYVFDRLKSETIVIFIKKKKNVSNSDRRFFGNKRVFFKIK